ncbi:MAG: C40 family peptidase [Chitinophagaceae bacterium]|nr:C40 family peptidase [Chitinophagaceae bacterium]
MLKYKIIFAKQLLLVFSVFQFLSGCLDAQKPAKKPSVNKDTVKNSTVNYPPKKIVNQYRNAGIIETADTKPAEILAFAKNLIGIPYLYASTDPAKGFDCSGFITYVFNHFNIAVPRSSVDFTNVGTEVDYRNAKPGDLILFTGTDSTIRIVGHMGIVESFENEVLKFIHSTSGKAKGVVITEFGKFYKSRFVKVIRIFTDDKF